MYVFALCFAFHVTTDIAIAKKTKKTKKKKKKKEKNRKKNKREKKEKIEAPTEATIAPTATITPTAPKKIEKQKIQETQVLTPKQTSEKLQDKIDNEENIFSEDDRDDEEARVSRKSRKPFSITIAGSPVAYYTLNKYNPQQFLISARELHAAGLNAPCKISEIIYANNNTCVKIGATTKKKLISLLKTHITTEEQPFYWDGHRNIVIEIENNNQTYSQRPVIKLSGLYTKSKAVTIMHIHNAKTNNSLWGITDKNYLYRWTGTQWVKQKTKGAPRLKSITAAPNGLMYALNTNGKLYTAVDASDDTSEPIIWDAYPLEKTDIELDQITLSGNILFALDCTNKNLYQLEGSHWKHIRTFASRAISLH